MQRLISLLALLLFVNSTTLVSEARPSGRATLSITNLRVTGAALPDGQASDTYSQVKTVADYLNDVNVLANRADVKAANDYIDRNQEGILREWIAITEINAPSGQEQPRAKYIEGLLRSLHLDDVHFDSAGNLIAVRKGTGGGPGDCLRRASRHRFSTGTANQSCRSRRQSLRARHRR